MSVQSYPDEQSWERDDAGVHLLGARCADCSTLAFPRLPYCPNCLSPDVEGQRLSQRGVVYSFTTIHTPSSEFSAPYTVGFVDLPEDLRVFAQFRATADTLQAGREAHVDVDQIRTSPDGSPVVSYVFTVED